MLKWIRMMLKPISSLILSILVAVVSIKAVMHDQERFIGLLFTIIAFVAIGGHLYDIFSGKWSSQYQVNIEATDSCHKKEKWFDEKLRKLKSLKDDGLISEEEYKVKRKEILDDRW